MPKADEKPKQEYSTEKWWARKKSTGKIDLVEVEKGTDKDGRAYEVIWELGSDITYGEDDFELLERIPDYKGGK